MLVAITRPLDAVHLLRVLVTVGCHVIGVTYVRLFNFLRASVLYKDGPPFYHATFSVVVRRACSETLEEDDDHRLRSWTSLASLVRINANAAKTVLLCYVLIPKETDFSTPECLRSFKIQEMIVRRWVTSEERGRKEEAP